MKTCTKCKRVLPEENFYRMWDKRKRTKDRRASRCKSCLVDIARWAQLKYKYGVTQEQYEAMLEMQGGRCAICRTDRPARGVKFFAVDHDHRSGRVRGLLCQSCNVGIGALDDDPNVILSAALYLMADEESQNRHQIEAHKRRLHNSTSPVQLPGRS